MKKFSELFGRFVAESVKADDVETTLGKYGLKNTANPNMDHKVYRPHGKPCSVGGFADVFHKLGYKRVTHYASGGPNSRMPESGPHVYAKEHGYAGRSTLEVHHDGKHIKHIIAGTSRSRD